jgi:hypothetical protein
MRKDNRPQSHKDTADAGPGDRIMRLLEVPPGSVGGFHIELNSNRELLLEGCRNVLEYTGALVRVDAGALILTMTGEGLNLRHLSADTLLVEGRIATLAFEG